MWRQKSPPSLEADSQIYQFQYTFGEHSVSGSTSAFQADRAGSSPAARSTMKERFYSISERRCFEIGLNENVKGLMRSVANNDLQKAKAYTRVLIENEKSESNKGFCNAIRTKLEVSSANLLELPADLRTFLEMEDVSVSFNEKRYHLTDRERAVYEKINAADEVNNRLSEMGIRHLNSTLLYGESGTGKTSFGRYVAYKLGIPFAYLNFAHCISSLLGTTAKNIANVFDYVKKRRCVFMLDEIDAIGLRRGKEDVGEMSRIVIGLMQSLDLLENGVVVIGATNRPDVIDEALIRRFSLKHEVKTLTDHETLQLATMFLDDVGVAYEEGNVLDYAKSHDKQAEIVNDIVFGIIEMLKSGKGFELKTME